MMNVYIVYIKVILALENIEPAYKAFIRIKTTDFFSFIVYNFARFHNHTNFKTILTYGG